MKMELINCTECGNEVSEKAKVCPHCGINHPRLKNHRLYYKTIYIGAGFIAFLLLILLGEGLEYFLSFF